MPRPLSRALLLVHALFVFTVLGGVGLLLTAASLDAVDGALLAQVACAAAPGALGWWLARRTWRGGTGIWAGLIVVQAWLVLGSVSNVADGSARGLSQLILPLLVLFLLTRPASRDWYRLALPDRHERHTFSPARSVRWRRDGGQTAVEYVGLIAVVAAIIAALTVSGPGGQISGGIRSAICEVTGTGCPATAPTSGDGTDVWAGDGSQDTDNNDGKPLTNTDRNSTTPDAGTTDDGEEDDGEDGIRKGEAPGGGDRKGEVPGGGSEGLAPGGGGSGDLGVGGGIRDGLGVGGGIRDGLGVGGGIRDGLEAEDGIRKHKGAEDRNRKHKETEGQRDTDNGIRSVSTAVWNVGSLVIPGYGEAKAVQINQSDDDAP
ncbi:hypothetical protein [Streptomyces sp. NPDC005009]